MDTVKKNKVRYNYNYLKLYCDDNNIELLKDYINEKVTRISIIEAKCKTDDCDGFVKKKFRDFIKTGCFCKNCVIKKWKDKIKKTNLERYGVENAFQSKEVRDKIKKTNLERFGVECSLQSQEVKDKVKKTILERFGVEHLFQSQDIKDKSKETNIERFGVEHPMKSKEVRKKVNKTNLERFGVEYPSQCKEVRDKVRKTNLERLGVEYPSQCQEVRDKAMKTNLERFRVENPSQNPEIAEKQLKNSYKRKLYTFPSGKTEYIQGYENTALDELFNSGVKEDDICVGCKNVPEIWYDDETNKKHRHYVDIFIKSQNKCIEVKSTWTSKLGKHYIFLKQQAAKKLGYEYEIWVYNNKRQKVECHK